MRCKKADEKTIVHLKLSVTTATLRMPIQHSPGSCQSAKKLRCLAPATPCFDERFLNSSVAIL